MSQILRAAPIRCLIGGVDYSEQVFSYSFAYEKLGDSVAGGVLPFSGDIQLGMDGDYHPINNRLNPALFSFSTPIQFSIQLSGVWYPLPPLEIELANYNSSAAQATIKCGDALYISSRTPEDTDSSVLDISIGGLRTSGYAMSRLLAQVGVSSITREFNSSVRFEYPRNLGNNYVTAIGQLCASEGTVAFTRPGGGAIVRATWTVANPQFSTDFPLPVLGIYRFGQREEATDVIALERPLAECSEIAMPGAIANKYECTGSFYRIFPTPAQETSTSPDGKTTTTTSRNFGAGRTTINTRIRENGPDVYAGIAGQSSGEIQSEEHTTIEQYDSGEPGRLLSKITTEEIRVAKLAKSLVGWYQQDEAGTHTNEDGLVTTSPFAGANWSSTITAKEVTEQWFYHSDKETVPRFKRITTRMAVVSILDGLTGGVDWGKILENSPYLMGSLRTAITEETQWVEKGKGSWEVYITTTTVKALSETGDRSAIISGLQKAAEDENTARISALIIEAMRTTRTTQRLPASPNNAPPAFTPKPRQYYGEGAEIKRDANYGYIGGSTRDVHKSVSIPFASDESGTAVGNSRAAQDVSNVLHIIARRDRMEAQSYQVMSPLYPELLAGMSPYSAIDVFMARDNATYRVITSGFSITGDRQEAAIHFVAPTLARRLGNQFISPFQEAQP